MEAEAWPSRLKLDSVLPMYQGIVWERSTCVTDPVCMEALVAMSAVLVSEMFHDVVVTVLEDRVLVGVAVSSLTPGAVTFTTMS